MRTVRFGPDASAADIRALAPPPPDVEADVRAIVDEVRTGGDAAVKRFTERFDHAGLAPESLLVPLHEIEAALSTLEPDVLRGLRTAVANVGQVAKAGLREHPARVELPERQVVELAEVPVRRAAAYVPGGRAPYPSTVVMCATVAKVAGVDELAVCAPPGPEGRAHPTILAACALCDVTEVYRMGGAQAIAAMAYGTETIPAVDVIVGPGNAYVTEAKRQVNGVVGIDGLAGPSELVVVATPGAEHGLLALDLLAQAEHGEGSLVVAISPDPQLLDAIVACVEELAAERPTVAEAPFAAVLVSDAAAAVRLADEIAPEHLELAGTEAEELARKVRSAGCVFVGRDAATAFGDYVAGSNHVLPTGGAARFASGLSPATFRRRMARVSLPPGAAARLAPLGAAVARAEGFSVHGESMERRA
ncbi:MAG TPA: histidinol dehydrogenase, partial [Thermoleophilaceae bacterium]|nr:histidinol dehydrogenase [Thermoleophilaceae bacterium]